MKTNTAIVLVCVMLAACAVFRGSADSASRRVSVSPCDAGVPDTGAGTPDAGSSSIGVWVNVTPSNADLVDTLDCSNFGTESVQPDPMAAGVLYTQFMCQGIWKSTDYGLTWTGPINTGRNGLAAGDSAGGITLAPGTGATEPPVIYSVGIRGNGTGFWKSTNGGVDWTNYVVGAAGSRQDYYPPVVDPYDANHLLMAAHEQNILVQSADGGQTWATVPMASGMLETSGTGEIFFVNTGDPCTTRNSWLWMAQQSGGVYGTWKTTSAGASWHQVDKMEHPHGSSQMYQPDTSGVVYIAGAYSTLGWGVVRSTNYGETWTHVGIGGSEGIVFGTSKNVYSMLGGPAGIGQIENPNLEIGPQPGTGTWVSTPTPAAMTQGPGQAAVLWDGVHSIIVTACWNAGLWRYVEP